jgi:hypothetical protein
LADTWGGSWASSWGLSWTRGSAPAPPAITPTGGIPLSYEEWARRKRKEEPEDEEPTPRVVEIIGPVNPPTTAPPVIRSSADLTAAVEHARALQTQGIPLSNRARKRRRRDDEWLMMH